MSILSGCFLKNDQQDALHKIEKLIECIECNDIEETKKLFAKSKISDIDNFDLSIQELFSYYNGEFDSRINLALKTDSDVDNGVMVKSYDMTYDFNTNICKYRLAIKWCAQDTSNADNVGIWSLYIIRAEDDITPNHAYWGDCLWTNGINIGKVYDGEW